MGSGAFVGNLVGVPLVLSLIPWVFRNISVPLKDEVGGVSIFDHFLVSSSDTFAKFVIAVFVLGVSKNNLLQCWVSMAFLVAGIFYGNLIMLPPLGLAIATLLRSDSRISPAQFAPLLPPVTKALWIPKGSAVSVRPDWFFIDWILVIVLTVLAAMTRLWRLDDPPATLFDEVHFGKFTNHHITGSYYFDIHPPLVKLIFHAILTIFTDYPGTQPFSTIGETFRPETPVFLFRLWPAITGIMLIPTVYLLAAELRLSQQARTLCAFMALSDLLFLGESRMILMDSSLLLFFALAFLCHLRASSHPLHSAKWFMWTFWTGFALGCTISTKWTGLSVVALVGISTLFDLMYRSRFNPPVLAEIKDVLIRLTLLLGVPLVMYVGLYAVFFSQLTKEGFGSGFMLPNFKAQLEGHELYGKFPAPTFLDKFSYLQYEMFRANKDIATPHSWQSYWYSWPLMERPINCWGGKREAGGTRRIYLFGNPVVWWIAFGALCASPLTWMIHRWFIQPRVREIQPQANYWSATMTLSNPYVHMMTQLYSGYAISLLPYALVNRACFLYHYMPALLMTILITGVLLDSLITFATPHVSWVLSCLMMAVCAWGFWFWGPMVYGLPLTNQDYQDRMWFDSWK